MIRNLISKVIVKKEHRKIIQKTLSLREDEEIIEEYSCNIKVEPHFSKCELFLWQTRLCIKSAKILDPETEEETMLVIPFSEMSSIELFKLDKNDCILISLNATKRLEKIGWRENLELDEISDIKLDKIDLKKNQIILYDFTSTNETFNVLRWLWEESSKKENNRVSKYGLGRVKYPDASEELKKLFPATSSPLVEYFECSQMVNKLLKPGKMYITQFTMYFKSEVNGKETVDLIPFYNVIQVEKLQKALLVPAIELTTTENIKYIFCAFFNRNKAFNTIKQLWMRALVHEEQGTISYTDEQLDDLLEQFKGIDINHEGKVSREAFASSLGLLLQDTHLADSMFNVFDVGKNSAISLREFLIGMKTLLIGTPKEKLEFSFKMYDHDEDGFISKSDLQNIVKAMQSLLGSEIEEEYGSFMENIFDSLDKDKDGKLSMQEYVEGALQNSHVLGMLGFNADQNSNSKEVKLVSFGDRNWVLVQYMLLGIRRVAIDQDIKNSDDLYSEKIYDLTRPGSSEKWIFTAYAPSIFEKIRELYLINNKNFLSSLGPDQFLGNLLMGKFSSMALLSSSGRSGSFFLQSPDGKYLIKTLPVVEAKLLLSILKNYFEHLKKWENSLLTRFFGLYNIKKNDDRGCYFVVMGNFLDTPLEIHELYDLKGSTIDRSVKEDQIKPGIALKDNDLKRKLKLEKKIKGFLISQIEEDTRFLESFNICDYSMLLGIHFESKDPMRKGKKTDNRSSFHQYSGGLRASKPTNEEKDIVYFLGIIDILTPYNFKKASEHNIKKVIHFQQPDAKSQISAVPPVLYQERFVKFISSIIEETISIHQREQYKKMMKQKYEEEQRMKNQAEALEKLEKRKSREQKDKRKAISVEPMAPETWDEEQTSSFLSNISH